MPESNPYFPDFDGLRAWRQRHYAGFDPASSPRRRRAIATIVHNESIFFPIWLGYYSQFFHAEDIYVLDHDTTDGSTDREGFHRIQIHHDDVDHHWLMQQVRNLQHDLLESYDVVVVCDSDEIIAPDPHAGIGDLGDYLHRFDEKFVNCFGVELIHLPGEPALDHTRPILAQRSHWYRNPLYDKPIVATVPMDWIVGFHRTTSGSNNYDPDLHLIHLHRMDRDICLARHELRARRSWSASDMTTGIGAQNRIVDPDEFDRWFLTDAGMPGVDLSPVRYDEAWNDVV